MKTLDVLSKVIKGKRMSPYTGDNYRKALTKLSEYSPEWPDNAVTINEFATTLNMADSSVNLYVKMVNLAGEYMEKHFGIKNPAKNAEKIKVSKKQRRYHKPEAMLAIMAACKFGYDRELVMTLIDSGCRIEGLTNLKYEDIEKQGFKAHEKTGVRKYRLLPQLCDALKNMAGAPGNYVFSKGNDGVTKLADSTLSHRVRNICVRAGLYGEKLGAHTLRHSVGTLVASKFLNPMLVQHILQHDDITSSMGYIHDVEDELAKISVSPLGLVAEYAQQQSSGRGFKQLALTQGESEIIDVDSKALVVVENGVPVENQGIIDDMGMFPEIPDNIEIRPKLNSADLNIIRDAFLLVADNGNHHRLILDSRQLIKRILRKTGVK